VILSAKAIEDGATYIFGIAVWALKEGHNCGACGDQYQSGLQLIKQNVLAKNNDGTATLKALLPIRTLYPACKRIKRFWFVTVSDPDGKMQLLCMKMLVKLLSVH
jgi:hypothetical protein